MPWGHHCDDVEHGDDKKTMLSVITMKPEKNYCSPSAARPPSRTLLEHWKNNSLGRPGIIMCLDRHICLAVFNEGPHVWAKQDGNNRGPPERLKQKIG